MEKVKFDEVDRDRVIDTLQEHYGVQLDKVGQRPKWRRDELGRNWWILGGVDEWHGIPKEMMKDEKERQIEGKLIIAVRKRTSIEVFAGPLSQLVSSRAELALREDQYHFNIVVQGDLMRIQGSDVILERIVSFPHSDEDRERLRKRNEALKTMEKLSFEELEELEERTGRLKHSGS